MIWYDMIWYDTMVWWFRKREIHSPMWSTHDDNCFIAFGIHQLSSSIVIKQNRGFFFFYWAKFMCPWGQVDPSQTVCINWSVKCAEEWKTPRNRGKRKGRWISTKHRLHVMDSSLTRLHISAIQTERAANDLIVVWSGQHFHAECYGPLSRFTVSEQTIAGEIQNQVTLHKALFSLQVIVFQ